VPADTSTLGVVPLILTAFHPFFPPWRQLVRAVNDVKKQIRDIVAPGTELEPVATLRRQGSFTRSQARQARTGGPTKQTTTSAPAAIEDYELSQGAAASQHHEASNHGTSAAASLGNTQWTDGDDVLVIHDEAPHACDDDEEDLPPAAAAARHPTRPKGDALLRMAATSEPAAKVITRRAIVPPLADVLVGQHLRRVSTDALLAHRICSDPHPPFSGPGGGRGAWTLTSSSIQMIHSLKSIRLNGP
jgi:hypothetical protein